MISFWWFHHAFSKNDRLQVPVLRRQVVTEWMVWVNTLILSVVVEDMGNGKVMTYNVFNLFYH